ncbi:uncharacterized protein LOC111639000 [Centruroides sculpturatus]|uniref:uncharacterized protein LOC111639000 n=1 Tax=Centruroides sculpturatus TaxID=218467 RepID=UPI000C6DCE7E|nr:uncharacterized protein LOC111639000 [Centruroides sculpturatus]
MSRDYATRIVQTQPRMYQSISQPPSVHGSPVSAFRVIPSPSQQALSRHGRIFGISRSSNSSPLTVSPEVVYFDPNFANLDSQSYEMEGRSTSHRSRSATRVSGRNYHSLEREPMSARERSLDRMEANARHARVRDRSLDRAFYRSREDQDIYVNHEMMPNSDPSYRGSYPPDSSRQGFSRDSFILELQTRLNELQNQYGNVKRELDSTNQKLGSSMHSIKTFWSPELKKERALRKEEAAKHTLINDQMKMLRTENQKQAALIQQLEEELRMAHMRNPDVDVQQHLEALYTEKEHMTKEIFLLRETIKVTIINKQNCHNKAKQPLDYIGLLLYLINY